MKSYLGKKILYMTTALEEMALALQKYKEEPSNRFYFYAAEKKAEEVVDCAIAINKEILYEKMEVDIKSYYDSFIQLKKIKIFSDPFTEKLAQTAGFRNRLVHDYIELDEKITLESMKNILKLYPKYLKEMINHLSNDA